MSKQLWGKKQNREIIRDAYNSNFDTITLDAIIEYYKQNGGVFGERGPQGEQGPPGLQIGRAHV
jgi:hypothetical protein